MAHCSELINFRTNLKLKNTEIIEDIFNDEPSNNEKFYLNKEYSIKTIQDRTLLLIENNQELELINKEFLDNMKSIDNSLEFSFNLRCKYHL